MLAHRHPRSLLIGRLIVTSALGLGLHAEQDLPAVKKALKMNYEVAALPEIVAEAFETQEGLSLPTVLVYGADGALLRVLAGASQLPAVLAELFFPAK